MDFVASPRARQLRTDPLGSTTLRRTNVGADATGALANFENRYQPGTGRLLFSRRPPPSNPSSDFAQDSTSRQYDAGGNVTRGYQRVGQSVSGVIRVSREEETRSYYGADDRLRAVQKLDIRSTDFETYESAGVWGGVPLRPAGAAGDGAHAHRRRVVRP
jgi:hypothetical protein